MAFVARDARTGAVDRHVERDVRIGVVPVMLHSSLCVLRGLGDAELRRAGECPYDVGGYFLIDGKEKVIVSQERTALNRLFVERATAADAKFSHVAFIRCVGDAEDEFSKPRTLYMRVVAPGQPGGRDGAVLLEVPGAVVVRIAFKLGEVRTAARRAHLDGGAEDHQRVALRASGERHRRDLSFAVGRREDVDRQHAVREHAPATNGVCHRNEPALHRQDARVLAAVPKVGENCLIADPS